MSSNREIKSALDDLRQHYTDAPPMGVNQFEGWARVLQKLTRSQLLAACEWWGMNRDRWPPSPAALLTTAHTSAMKARRVVEEANEEIQREDRTPEQTRMAAAAMKVISKILEGTLRAPDEIRGKNPPHVKDREWHYWDKYIREKMDEASQR